MINFQAIILILFATKVGTSLIAKKLKTTSVDATICGKTLNAQTTQGTFGIFAKNHAVVVKVFIQNLPPDVKPKNF